MNPLALPSPELKKLWIRVLKRVHPDLAVDEQDRGRCELLTQQANEAYVRGDEAALRAVLVPKGPSLRPHSPHDARAVRAQNQRAPQSAYPSPPAPQQPLTVRGRPTLALLWAACAVLCLLLYGIFDALSEQVGRPTSVTVLAMITAAVLFLITRNSGSSYNHKAKWVAAVAITMTLVGICLLDTSRPRATPLFPSARAAALPAPFELKDSANRPPSQRYWDVIKSRVGASWNPSTVVNTPASATADITFTISRDGSPRDVQLRKPSGYPPLDSSCVLAVQQVRTFGPPEGGARDSLNVLYPCSYNELDSMNPHPAQSNTPQEKTSVTVKNLDSQLGGYLEAVNNKVGQKWNLSEVAGSTPVGATVYIQFAIRRSGNHEAPTMETSSGYASLDVSCLRAVEQMQTFGHLPKGYTGDSLTVLHHCTYPGSPTTKLTQDSILAPSQQPLPDGAGDGVHGVQQPLNSTAVNN